MKSFLLNAVLMFSFDFMLFIIKVTTLDVKMSIY